MGRLFVMGWTGYTGMTAAQAIEYELHGCEVIRSSGAWRLFKTLGGEVMLAQCLTERHGDEVAVKIVPADMGPFGVPTRAMLCDYLARTNDRERGRYEREWLDRCQRALDQRDAAKGIKPGDVIRFTRPLRFSDGIEEDTFTWTGKYRAQRATDGRLVRLPKTWRSQLVMGGV